jgi:hypothetical protein
MIGFPAALAYPTTQVGSTVNLASKRRYERPVAVEPSQFRSNKFDPAMHLAVTFPSADKFSPGGFSGSGLWCEQEGNQKVWGANPVYVGMVLAEL